MSDFSELDQVRPGVRATAVADVRRRPRSPGMLARFFRSLNIWFWAIVGVPTLIAAVYYFAIASNLYLSEAQFIVRSPNKAAVSGIGAALAAAGASHGDEDTVAVQDFIESRDAVRKLEQHQDLRALLDRPEGDVITRFPGAMFWRKDFEALYSHYKRFVSVDIDSSSGVSTLDVKAYRPQDALAIAQALLSYSEELVNQLNARARENALSTFEHEVHSSEQRLQTIQGELTAYRISRNMLDPKSEAAGPLELLAQLNTQLASARAQLAEAVANSPHSPQIPLVKTRIASLDKLVTDQRAKITGDSNSVATSLKEYERLDLDQKLAEKALAADFASLEQARIEAQRQQLYLETIAQPNLADYPLYPKRFASFITVVASCLLVYSILWLLVASVREHGAA